VIRFPPFQERVLGMVLPACERFHLLLAGGHAMRAHGFMDRPSTDLDFATSADTPLPEVAEGIAQALRAAGLEVSVLEVTPRYGRLLLKDPSTEEHCEVDLLREALQQQPSVCGELRVVALDDAVGLKMRALYERSLARDVIDIAAVAHLYSFRDLERLGGLHAEDFSLPELVMRLEFVEFIADEEFAAYGVTADRVRDIRRLTSAWADDIKMRRADDGDAEYDVSDLPGVD
jgi:hypothetical protein